MLDCPMRRLALFFGGGEVGITGLQRALRGRYRAWTWCRQGVEQCCKSNASPDLKRYAPAESSQKPCPQPIPPKKAASPASLPTPGSSLPPSSSSLIVGFDVRRNRPKISAMVGGDRVCEKRQVFISSDEANRASSGWGRMGRASIDFPPMILRFK